MRVTEVPEAAGFLDRAAPVLGRDPAANNLALGIAQHVVDHPGSYEEPSFWVAERSGDVVGAAMRTPPYPLILADPLDEAVPEAVAVELAGRGVDLPGVTANEPWAGRFAAAWAAAAGVPWHVGLAQGVFRLASVRPPDRPADGAPRAATEADRALLVAWIDAFADEALTAMVRDDRATERGVDARLGPGATGGFDLWEVDDRPVSLTGWSPIAGGARVGPVYTPPDERGRGYASTLVAHVSARILDGGADACFLYTDLGNPTSNAIYRRLGYEQVAESSMIVFERP
jgi:GNAT superfamily N-acetyltransferase